MANKTLTALVGTGAILASAVNTSADGWLKVFDKVDSSEAEVSLLQGNNVGYTDDYDNQPLDVERDLGQIVGPQPLSVIPGYDLVKDTRNNNSSKPFLINLYYSGNLSQDTTNYLTLKFPNSSMKFQDHNNLTFRGINFDGQQITNVLDIKSTLSNTNSFTFPIGVMHAGDYSAVTNYAAVQIDFDPLVPNQPPVIIGNPTFSGFSRENISGSISVQEGSASVTNTYVEVHNNENISVSGLTNLLYNSGNFVGSKSFGVYAVDANGLYSNTNTVNFISNNPDFVKLELVDNESGITRTNTFQFEHRSGASEAFVEGEDEGYSNPGNSSIDFFSSPQGGGIAGKDVRPIGNTNVTANIVGTPGLPLTPATIRPIMPTLTNSYPNNGVYGYLYQSGNPRTLLGTYDLKALAANGGAISIDVDKNAHYEFDGRILPSNNAPVASNQQFFGHKLEDISGSFNVSDFDGSISEVVLLDADSNISQSGITNFHYNAGGFVGSKTYHFYAKDNMDAKSTTNNLEFITINNQPLASDKEISLAKRETYNGCFDVSDVDGYVDGIELINGDSSISLNGTTNFTLNLNGQVGDKVYQFRARDNNGDFSEVHNLTARSTNTPPVAFVMSNTAVAEVPLQIILQGYDADGDPLIFKTPNAPNPQNAYLEDIVGGVTNTIGNGSTLSSSNVWFTSMNNIYGSGAGNFRYSVSDGEATTLGTNLVDVLAVDRQPYFTNVMSGSNNISFSIVCQPNRTLKLLGKENVGDTNDWNVIWQQRVPIFGYGETNQLPPINYPEYTKKSFYMPITNGSYFFNLESVAD